MSWKAWKANQATSFTAIRRIGTNAERSVRLALRSRRARCGSDRGGTRRVHRNVDALRSEHLQQLGVMVLGGQLGQGLDDCPIRALERKALLAVLLSPVDFVLVGAVLSRRRTEWPSSSRRAPRHRVLRRCG